MEQQNRKKNRKEQPEGKKCLDRNCPLHGQISLRGRVFTGVVIRAKMQKTVIVEWITQRYSPKFERFEKWSSHVKAHNPDCLGAQEGDIVKIAECRPLSKTKNFVVAEILGKEKGFAERMESLKEAKQKHEEQVPVEVENASSESAGD
ncbi:30S ribosomal protein S17 [Candidatus Woesearchaeota archaeon]|nr:30S ribosomal protein S17 [Candidatus Woesearchaeota archaeon]